MIDFIILGAQKSGTTAAAHNLNQHPEVAVFSGITEYGQRELEFFNQHWDRGVNWYYNQLPSGNLVGEKTAELFHRTICHQRIRSVNPQVKLIILLRNPVDRAYSQWKMAFFNKKDEFRSFEEVIQTEQAQLNTPNFKDRFYNLHPHQISCWREGYLIKGFYVEQLESLFNLFPRNQVHIAVTERIRANMTDEYNKMFSFLGVKSYETEFGHYFVGKAHDPMARKMREFLTGFYRDKNASLFDLLGYRVLEWL